MPLTSRDSLSRLAIQQIAGSAGSTRYLGRESRPPKTDFEDLSRPENFLIVRIVSLCVGVRPRHNSDWRGGIVPSRPRHNSDWRGGIVPGIFYNCQNRLPLCWGQTP